MKSIRSCLCLPVLICGLLAAPPLRAAPPLPFVFSNAPTIATNASANVPITTNIPAASYQYYRVQGAPAPAVNQPQSVAIFTGFACTGGPTNTVTLTFYPFKIVAAANSNSIVAVFNGSTNNVVVATTGGFTVADLGNGTNQIAGWHFVDRTNYYGADGFVLGAVTQSGTNSVIINGNTLVSPAQGNQ